MSSHPWDWCIHFELCFTPVCFGWASWFIVLFVGVLIEYEQKFQIWYNHLNWREYIIYHVMGDMVANVFGIVVGVLL